MVRLILVSRRLILQLRIIDSFPSAAIEASIFISQAIWLIRTRGIRKHAKEAGMTWEDLPEAQDWEEKGWSLAKRRRANSSSSKSTTEHECASGDIEQGNQKTAQEVPPLTQRS